MVIVVWWCRRSSRGLDNDPDPVALAFFNDRLDRPAPGGHPRQRGQRRVGRGIRAIELPIRQRGPDRAPQHQPLIAAGHFFVGHNHAPYGDFNFQWALGAFMNNEALPISWAHCWASSSTPERAGRRGPDASGWADARGPWRARRHDLWSLRPGLFIPRDLSEKQLVFLMDLVQQVAGRPIAFVHRDPAKRHHALGHDGRKHLGPELGFRLEGHGSGDDALFPAGVVVSANQALGKYRRRSSKVAPNALAYANTTLA